MNFEGDVIKLGNFDISSLRDEVFKLSNEDWSQDLHRQEKFIVHTDTETIGLLFDPDYRHQNPTSHPMLDVFQTHIDPLLRHIEEDYCKTMRQRKAIAKNGPGYFVRIILTRLAPGRKIAPHTDDGYSLKRCHRIHVPLVTNDACIFRVGKTLRNMRAGEMWEINNRRIHAVNNDCDEHRIHLILDYVQPGERVFDIDGPLVA